ncbi:MAG TPA: ABC transporter substrate-binding protein [Ktedonobacteraceae bacterium]
MLSIPLLAACGGSQASTGGTSSASKGPFTIGVSNGFVNSEWRTQMIQDLQDANAQYEKQGLTKNLIVENADVDAQGQIQQIRNLINRGVNAIIVDPNSQTALNSVIQQAKSAGIIVIAVDQEVTSPAATNVVINQADWATMSAEWLAKQLNGKGNIVAVNGTAGAPANDMRWNAAKAVFSKYPNIKILNNINANWDQATGQQMMASELASQPNIDAIWSQDGMAQGVLRAVMAANPSKFLIMTGEARTKYLQLWQQAKQAHPNFTSYGVINPPGSAVSGLRIALQMLQGKTLKSGELKGSANNTIYVPIPGFVDQSNFTQQYDQYKSKSAEYSLDGSISDSDAQSLFN